jgi:hypothetical protein
MQPSASVLAYAAAAGCGNSVGHLGTIEAGAKLPGRPSDDGHLTGNRLPSGRRGGHCPPAVPLPGGHATLLHPLWHIDDYADDEVTLKSRHFPCCRFKISSAMQFSPERGSRVGCMEPDRYPAQRPQASGQPPGWPQGCSPASTRPNRQGQGSQCRGRQRQAHRWHLQNSIPAPGPEKMTRCRQY